jgi:hypothetical protein
MPARINSHGYLYGGSSYAMLDAPYPADLQAAAKAGLLRARGLEAAASRRTRGGTILQLALYSELLGLVQGKDPEHFANEA